MIPSILPCCMSSYGETPTCLAHSCHDKFSRRAMVARLFGWMVLNTPSRTERMMLLAASGMAPPEYPSPKTIPTLGTSTLDISVIKREILCAWLPRLASASDAAPGVSMRLTIGIARLEHFSTNATAARWCCGIHVPFWIERSCAIKPIKRSSPSKSIATVAQ